MTYYYVVHDHDGAIVSAGYSTAEESDIDIPVAHGLSVLRVDRRLYRQEWLNHRVVNGELT